MRTYKEFIIHTEPFNTEVLSSVLWELNISGINEGDYFLKIFSDENNVTAKDIEDQLLKLKSEGLLSTYRIDEKTFDYQNWNEEWEKKTNVIKVSESIVIKPTFREYIPAHNETVIVIDPKMSFGTGEHQTTKLSLIYIHKYTKQGYRVLDAGTGTGVLAIAAVKFGAEYALGIDIDEWAEPNFKENAKLNSVEENVEVRTCELKDIKENNFDLIAANIQKNILRNICEDIYQHLKVNGIVILSGLLLIDEEEITNQYTNQGFKLLERDNMDEWLVLAFEKK